MTQRRPWRRLLRAGRPDVGGDVRDEVAFHLEMQVRDLVAEGWAEDAARAEAVRRFGDIQRVERSMVDIGKSRVRATRRAQLLGDLRQDVRLALRQLRKRPGFALATVAILGLGVGASAAVFGVVDAALFRALPFPEHAELYYVMDRQGEEDVYSASLPEFEDWERDADFFEAIAAGATNLYTLMQDGVPEQVQAGLIAGDLLGVHGLAPLVGRGFTAEEREAGVRVALLAEGFWRDRFAADPGVIGREIVLNDESYAIIGVMPREAAVLLDDPGVVLWLPLPQLEWMTRGLHFLTVVGRLADGVSVEQAEARRAAIERALIESAVTEHGIALHPVRDVLVGDARTLLLVLLGSVFFVLAIVCANLANLFLAHSMGRTREFAVRIAIGAGRFRLTRQVLTEALVLGVLGGLAGLALARVLAGAVVAASDDAAILAGASSLDGRVLAFALLVSLGCAVLFALWPALRLTHAALGRDLVEAGGARAFGGRAAWRRRRLLVAAEVALSAVLLAGAGLLAKSLVLLLRVDPGFRSENVLTFEISLPDTRYDEDARISAFHEQLLERLRALPEVVAAGAANHVPLGGSNTSGSFQIPGRPEETDAPAPNANKRVVAAGYFEALAIPLRSGRTFRASDRAGAPDVVIISEAVARRYWPGVDPVGQRMRFGWGPGDEQEIVGVVGDVRHAGLDAAVAGEIYRPIGQFAFPGMTFVIRTRGAPSALAAAARAQVFALDPLQPIAAVRTMDAIVAASVAARRTFMLLITGFAALALILAALGIYAVTAQSVLQRRREIGLRMAVGARGGDVLRLVLRQEVAVVGLGLLAGTAGALASTRVLAASLFGVSATDPATLAFVLAALAAIGLIAALVPARRASRVDPAVTLRSE
jgi:predicted permease